MKEQLKFVQILRGFAAIAVVVYFLDSITLVYFRYSLFHFNYGYLAINFFFALSGFIITYVHLKEIQHSRSVRKFILKRFVRVYPLYWLVLLFTIGLESPEFKEKPSLLSAINPTTTEGWIIIIKNIILYPLPDSQMPLGIAWGLPYAIIFYILFALCIKLGWKATKYIFTGWLLLILLYSFHIFSGSLLLIQTVLSPLNIQILTGCIAGYFFTKRRFRIKTSVFIYLIVSIAMLTMAFIYWKGSDNRNLLFTTMVGITSSLIIFYTASLDRDKLSKNLGSSLLVLIGAASYSIFLTHILFIPYICIALNKVLNVPVIPVLLKSILIILVLLLTIVAGVITHLIIERQVLNFLRNKLRLKRQKKSWI